MAKHIESIITDKVDLQVYECECGFHIGIDSSYLDQVDDVTIKCPSCGSYISTDEEGIKS